LLVFTAAGRTCACEIGAVREIIPFRRATRLPGAPAFVTGLINLRGSIVTVLDLSLRLGGRPTDPDTGSIILAEAGTKIVGLGVDQLRDVQRVPRSAIEPAGDEAGGDGLVCGILRVADDLAVLLDVGRIVGHALL
jgi:purine-binding chemotaxis protein CheW